MAKKIWIYVAGIVTGIAMTFLFALIFAGGNERTIENGITMFNTPGECVSEKSFKVMQVLDTGDALAAEMDDTFSGIPTGVTALFLHGQHSSFYDGQIIKVPSGKCARQIGTFKYKTNGGFDSTIPIVEIN